MRPPTDGSHSKLVLQHRDIERSRAKGLGAWEASGHCSSVPRSFPSPGPSEPLNFAVPRGTSGWRPNLGDAGLLERASGGETQALAPRRADELHPHGQGPLRG
jgi:hypothetical protein